MAVADPNRILVTGGSAFPGRAIAAGLAVRGWSVRAPLREELDLADDEAVRKWLHGRPVAAVIHAASAPPRRDPRLEETPVDLHMRMFLNLCRNRDCFGRMLVIGSGDEYGPRSIPPRVREAQFGRRIPVEDSAFAKFSVSKLVEQFGERFAVLRVFGLYGPDEEGATQPSFVQSAVRDALARREIEIAADRRVDFLLVDDLVAVIDAMLRRPALRHRAYNVTAGRSPTLSEVARLALAATGAGGEPRRGGGRAPDFTGDDQRLRTELPELALTPIAAGVAAVAEQLGAARRGSATG